MRRYLQLLTLSLLHFVCCPVCRFQPAGLVERIQAIAQNVSNMATRVEQILQNSMVQGRGRLQMSRIEYRVWLHESWVSDQQGFSLISSAAPQYLERRTFKYFLSALCRKEHLWCSACNEEPWISYKERVTVWENRVVQSATVVQGSHDSPIREWVWMFCKHTNCVAVLSVIFFS